jgi:hypothetical protein
MPGTLTLTPYVSKPYDWVDSIYLEPRRQEEYRPDIYEIDGLLQTIEDTVLEYMNSTDDDEYEIPPGLEEMVQDDDVRFYYGIYFPTSEGRVYSYI